MRAVHVQARPGLVLAVAFAAAAAVSAVLPARTGSWLPLHLLLAGTVLLAISATTQLFTVTWSAAPAPPGGLVRAQRTLLASGAAGVALGRELRWPVGLVAAAGVLVLVALVLLAGIILSTVRRGAVRRFDVAARGYAAGCVFGAAGVALGAAMAVGAGDGSLRDAHVSANLLGLVGLVVLATLPTFVPATARMRTGSRLDGRAAARPLLAASAGVTLAGTGLLAGDGGVAAAGLLLWVLALLGTLRLLPRPGTKQLRWAGPRLVAVGLAITWLGAGVTAAAVLAASGHDPFPPRVLAAVAVGGYVQLVWAALCYLVPVLAGGGHEALGRGLATTRSWTGLVAANLVPLLVVAGAGAPAVAAGMIWLVDSGVRFGAVARARRQQAVAPTAC